MAEKVSSTSIGNFSACDLTSLTLSSDPKKIFFKIRLNFVHCVSGTGTNFVVSSFPPSSSSVSREIRGALIVCFLNHRKMQCFFFFTWEIRVFEDHLGFRDKVQNKINTSICICKESVQRLLDHVCYIFSSLVE